MHKNELNDFLNKHFPQIQNTGAVHLVTEREVIFSLHPDDSHLRPGNTISGPTMMALADVTAYGTILNRIGPNTMTVTTNLNINFLHKPQADVPMLARGSLLKLGKRLAICEVAIEQTWPTSTEPTLVAHCTCTYSIAPQT
ncbi:MAG: PaaI family thioesterase [Gammaproteobacteria bacterium]|jgi:acyl-coenzyme A thioesterase PaaI-like protein|nr:PaaI family thioesterase [Gammaproteobacteria bacterium]